MAFRFFADIQKLDEEQRLVHGYASTEALDSQGEIVTKAALEGALADYLEWSNVREMHRPSAVGVTKSAVMDEKGLYIIAKISDDSAWEKVKDGVYKGFSIGGKVRKRDSADPNIITALQMAEISLVDRPANPEARIEFFKADDVNMDDPADDLLPAPGGEPMPDPVIPPPEVPEVVLDPVPAPDAPVPDPETEKAAAPADLEKGMGHVSDLAWMLKSLSYLVADQAAEALREGDQSKIPARLQAWLEAGAKILQAMTAEEVAELATQTAASIDLIADATSAPTTDPMGNPIALAAAVTDLEKKGSRNSKQDAERLTQIHDLLVALHPGVCPQVPDSQVAENQGASSSAKAADADDLQKAAALTEEALAKVADLEKTLQTKNEELEKASADVQTLTKRVATLEAMPQLPKGAQKVVPLQKGEEQRPEDDPIVKAAAAGDVKAQFALALRRPVPVHFS